VFHMLRGELRTAQALVEECLQIAEQANEARGLLPAHLAVGITCLYRGECVRAQGALAKNIALYQPQHHALTPLCGGVNPQVGSLSVVAIVLWHLGYPEQALRRNHEALQLARELGHPQSLAQALSWNAWLQTECGDGHVAQEYADAMVALASKHGFPFYLVLGTFRRGRALIVQGQLEEGISQVRQGLEAQVGEASRPVYLTWLAVGYGAVGQVAEGLATVAEALRLVEKTDERWYEAELYRLKGTLTLQSQISLKQVSGQSQAGQNKSEDTSPQPPTPSTQAEAEAEACFLKAIEIAQQQQAKSLELRATVSLARLWQQQSKTKQAHTMLSEVYGWFTEGFDTKDLQEAGGLLKELNH